MPQPAGRRRPDADATNGGGRERGEPAAQEVTQVRGRRGSLFIIREDHVRPTHLVFPRQPGTENTVEMIEKSVLDLCLIDKGLSVLGWIRTHFKQAVFLSSVDWHTQFVYQQLLPEAVEVVCPPLQLQ